MSDFLTRLAERALGVASIVEPSLPAVFAEPREIVDEGPFEMIEDNAGAASSAVAQATTHPAAASASTESIPAPMARPSAGTLPMTSTAAAERTQPLASPREARPSLNDPSRDANTAPAQPAARPLVESLSALSTEPPAGSPRTTPSEVRPPLAATRGDRGTKPPAAIQPLVPTRQPSASLDRFEVDASPRRQIAEPATSVRITIGRVEVRAVTPQPQPERGRRQPEAEAPRVSLSDYLKRGAPQARNTR